MSPNTSAEATPKTDDHHLVIERPQKEPIMGLDQFNLSSRLWQGVASLYAFFLIVALLGVMALAEGEIIEGILVITASSLGAWFMHKAVTRYLRGRHY